MMLLIDVLSRFTRVSIPIALALLLALPTASAQTPPESPAYDPNELHLIKPEMREEVAAAMPEGMTEYDIEVEFPDDIGQRVLFGFMTVRYTNTTGDDLDAIPFRLYANSADPEHDAITLDAVSVAGLGVQPILSEMNSIAIVPLPEMLPAGETVLISMAFTTTVPVDDPAHYGMLNIASATETWSLAHWYPTVAGRDPEGGWMLAPTSVYGDPVFSDAGMYTVRVSAPDNLQLITSGVEIASEPAESGRTISTWSAAPSRDFVMLADADIQSVQSDLNGTMVTSWYHSGHDAAGEASLLWTGQSLELFNRLLGEYPYVQLQAVEAAMFFAAGVEYPQLFTIADTYYETSPNLDSHGYFEFTVAHEVVHQWFYSIVGNNQYADAFIDEGLANYLSSWVYFSHLYGEEPARDVFERNIAGPFRFMVESNADVIVATSTDAFPSSSHYVNAAYVKAPMGFAAIHEQLGDEAFFGGLQSYVEEFRFRVATPDDLLAAFGNAYGTDISSLWTRWFERREGTLDIRNESEGPGIPRMA